jgi:hypothetical protein
LGSPHAPPARWRTGRCSSTTPGRIGWCEIVLLEVLWVCRSRGSKGRRL